ncbi:hypothetical protein KY290_021340 [Solanum tuberosum]|uniref:Uncharacterized protein n=1 Tax=Solanum tuberosum TaxID=4113 RepID=A0ABQ7V1A5_SOLTU|nr:hypothetical protein KY289_020497 [Solanum tuberosum]KAH0757847.1 hypothetical protein KY290_021340 [Solanum tuberosum]
MPPNEPEHDDAEGWCKTTMDYTKWQIVDKFYLFFATLGCGAYFLAPVGVVTSVIGQWAGGRLPRVGTLSMAGENGDNSTEMSQEVERDFELTALVTQLNELSTKITEVAILTPKKLKEL